MSDMPDNQTTPDAQSPCQDGCARIVCVLNDQGLHARPAARLAQAAQGFEADISITMGQTTVDAKSILDILTLAAGHGVNLELRARGADADEALSTLEDMFKNRFQ